MSPRVFAAVAVSLLIAGSTSPVAFAQGASAISKPIGTYYYQLPTRVPVRAGTARILRSRCDSSYPMTEESPCGTATGGPAGGLHGS